MTGGPIQVHFGSFQVANILQPLDPQIPRLAVEPSIVRLCAEDIILVEDSKKSDCHLVRYCWNLDCFNLVCTLNTVSSIYHYISLYISWKQYHLYSIIFIYIHLMYEILELSCILETKGC